MTNMVEAIADKLLDDHMARMAENKRMRAVLEQALEALESCSGVPHWPALRPAINDLRTALKGEV